MTGTIPEEGRMVLADGSTRPIRMWHLDGADNATVLIAGDDAVEVRDMAGKLLFTRSSSGDLVRPASRTSYHEQHFVDH